LYKALALGLLLIASACTKVSDENESDTPRVHWSAEKKAMYQSWSKTQCYYEERPFGIFLVNRNDTMQEEFLKTNGMLVEFNIEWQTDSTYTLSFKRLVSNPRGTSLPNGLDTLVRKCWMKQVGQTSYLEAATSNMTAHKDTIYTTYLRPDKRLGPMMAR
jgi:hypothetical protein